jgi:hypothetical protein
MHDMSGSIALRRHILQAIENLTATELAQLERFARYRMATDPLGRTGDDLLHEAITSTLAGDRSWNRNFGFVAHLFLAMRSISSHWRKQAHCRCHERDDIERADPERIAQAREVLEELTKDFANDPDVLHVLEAYRLGLTSAEGQQTYSLSRLDYRAAAKRLQRAAAKLLEK